MRLTPDRVAKRRRPTALAPLARRFARPQERAGALALARRLVSSPSGYTDIPWARPPKHESSPVSLRALLRGRRRDLPPTRLARAAWAGAGLLPLAGCASSFVIGASSGRANGSSK